MTNGEILRGPDEAMKSWKKSLEHIKWGGQSEEVSLESSCYKFHSGSIRE